MSVDVDSMSVNELKRLQNKIEGEIEAKQTAKDNSRELYEAIKGDFARHKREDGRKTFRGVVDYLECYVRGLPPATQGKFFARFGVKRTRGKVTANLRDQIKADLNAGKTLKAAGEAAGVSIATAMKVKKGEYDDAS